MPKAPPHPAPAPTMARKEEPSNHCDALVPAKCRPVSTPSRVKHIPQSKMENDNANSQATGSHADPGPMPAETQLDQDSQALGATHKRELGAESQNNEPESRRKLSDGSTPPPKAPQQVAEQRQPGVGSTSSPPPEATCKAAAAEILAARAATPPSQAPPPSPTPQETWQAGVAAVAPPSILRQPKPSAPAPPSKAAPRVSFEEQRFEVTGNGATIENGSQKEREKHYAAFKRQVTGEVGTEMVPHEFVEAWQAAVVSKSKTAKNKLFQLWCSAGGSWSRISGL